MSDQELLESLKKLGWSEEAARIGMRAAFCCEYCGRDMVASVEDYVTWQRDHVDPASGGAPGERDHFENYALACRTCNLMKRAKRFPGESREEKVQAVRSHIAAKRVEKMQEVTKVYELVARWRAERSC